VPYVAICRDDPQRDTGALREAHKLAHFAYIESILGRLLVAGPLPQPPDGAHRASLFVYAVETEVEARAMLQADPYFQAGIYSDVELQAFLPAAGGWIGGTVW
jgi:uncharacterized protein YciI